MIMGELGKLIEKLEGWDAKDWYEVLEAKKDGDVWILTVKHRSTKKSEEEKK